jgi:prepilin-type N-terminal cleavage/methylation domain-containing protein
MRSEKGFTLVEFMIVAAIIGIGVIIAHANIVDWIAHNRSVGFHREVAQMLEEARTRAIASQRQHRIVIDPAAENVSLERGDLGSGSGVWTGIRATLTAPAGTSFTDVLTTQGGVTTTEAVNPVIVTVNPSSDIFPLDLVRIHITNDLGEDWTVRIFGWTSRVRVENGTT